MDKTNKKKEEKNEKYDDSVNFLLRAQNGEFTEFAHGQNLCRVIEYRAEQPENYTISLSN